MRREYNIQKDFDFYFFAELDNATTLGKKDVCGHSFINEGVNLKTATFNGVDCCQFQNGAQVRYDIDDNIYPLTIVFNICRTSTSGHGALFFLNYENAAEKRVEMCNISSTGANRLIFCDLPGVSYGSSNYSQISNNVWYNVINVVNGANSKVFINGVLDKNITMTSSIDGSYVKVLGIGADYSTTNNYARGYIRKFGLINRAIEGDDINKLYQFTKVK